MEQTLGQMVREHRRKARLTRVALARLCGVGRTTIFDIEHGRLSVQFDKLLAILKALNIRVSLHSPLEGGDEGGTSLSL